MNAIVGFHLCTLTHHELMQRVDAMTDEMYETGKIPTRNIPARPNDDYDLLVGELLLRFKEKVDNDPNRITWDSIRQTETTNPTSPDQERA